MIKFLPIVVLVALAGIVFFFARGRFSSPPVAPTLSTSATTTQPEVTLAPANSTLEIRVKALEDAILLLGRQIVALKSGGAVQNTTSYNDTKIANLETTVKNLQSQIDTLKGVSTTAPTSAKKSPVYIPLGSGGTANDRNWYSVASYQANINPGDYPGYTSMQLEMVMNLNESVGTANARLYNKTDSSAVSSSNVSTSATSATLLTSSGFTLPAGAKTYVLQVQSTEGYTLNLQSARIKVNF